MFDLLREIFKIKSQERRDDDDDNDDERNKFRRVVYGAEVVAAKAEGREPVAWEDLFPRSRDYHR